MGALNTSGGEANVSWLLDLFGQYRRSKESALASLDSAYASADVARLAFLQDLVSTYIDARFYQERIALSKANLQSRRETLRPHQVPAGSRGRLQARRRPGRGPGAVDAAPKSPVWKPTSASRRITSPRCSACRPPR